MASECSVLISMCYNMVDPASTPVIPAMLRAAQRLVPLYAYNDALLEHLADLGSLHYYMNSGGLLAKFRVGEHNICVEEASNYASAKNSYGFFNSENSWTNLKFVAYYDNYAVNPLVVDFKSYNGDVGVGAYSNHSSFRNRNFIYEPDAFDIFKAELVIRLARLRRFRLLFDTMVEFGFRFFGFNSDWNFFEFDGVPYSVYLLPHSATFQFESCSLDKEVRQLVRPPRIVVGDIGGSLKPTAVAQLASKKVWDTLTGDFDTIWGNIFKYTPDQRSWLRLHGSISKRAICNRLSDIVTMHAINVKYGSSPSWY